MERKKSNKKFILIVGIVLVSIVLTFGIFSWIQKIKIQKVQEDNIKYNTIYTKLTVTKSGFLWV